MSFPFPVQELPYEPMTYLCWDGDGKEFSQADWVKIRDSVGFKEVTTFKLFNCLIPHDCTVYRDMRDQPTVTFVNEKTEMFESHFVDMLETIQEAKHLKFLKLDDKAFELMGVDDEENFGTPEKALEKLCLQLASKSKVKWFFVGPVNLAKSKVLAEHLVDMQLEIFRAEVERVDEDSEQGLPKDRDPCNILLGAAEHNKHFGVFEDKERELFAAKNGLLGFSIGCFQGEDPSLKHYSGCSEQDLEDIKNICKENAAAAIVEKKKAAKVKELAANKQKRKAKRDEKASKKAKIQAAAKKDDEEE